MIIATTIHHRIVITGAEVEMMMFVEQLATAQAIMIMIVAKHRIAYSVIATGQVVAMLLKFMV